MLWLTEQRPLQVREKRGQRPQNDITAAKRENNCREVDLNLYEYLETTALHKVDLPSLKKTLSN